MKLPLILLTLVCTLSQVHGQRFSSKINRLGIGADATFLQIDSDAIKTKTKTGFAGYLETRGEVSRSFDIIYAIGIFNHFIEFKEFASSETLDASMLGAEVKLLFAFRPFKTEYVTIEAGPAFMLNGEFKINDEDKTKFIGSDTPILLEEFEKTNPINLNGVVGLSAGTNNIRITAHYHHSFFDSLESSDTLGNEVDGNFSYLSAGVRFYF